jgi:hypothetical protein
MWRNVGKIGGTNSRMWELSSPNNGKGYQICLGNSLPSDSRTIDQTVNAALCLHGFAAYPYNESGKYRQISLHNLRVSLCGNDKMPLDFAGTFANHLLMDHYGNPFFVVDLTVMPSQLGPLVTTYDKTEKRRKSSTHRIFAACGCGRSIPVGRLIQHLKYHK